MRLTASTRHAPGRPRALARAIPSMAPSTLLIAALGVLLPGAALGGCAQPRVADITTIFLVRHAEKHLDRDDPDLTQAGRQRAAVLARALRSVPLDAVYSTDTHRTRQTAAPVADSRSLEVRLYGGDLVRLAARLRQRPGRYLVVGHSNTTPELVALLGGEPGPPIDELTEHDRLYLLVLHPDGTTTTLLLRYGAPPP